MNNSSHIDTNVNDNINTDQEDTNYPEKINDATVAIAVTDNVNTNASNNNNNNSNHLNNKPTPHNYNEHDEEEDDDDDEDDMFEQLLPPKPEYGSHTDEDLDELLGIELNTIDTKDGKTSKTNKNNKNKSNDNGNHKVYGKAHKERKCCVRKYGNTIILHTTCFKKSRYGLIGPHYGGVVCTIALLFGGSSFFTKKAFEDVGLISGYTCIIFTIMASYNLLRIVCVDPGIVKREDQIIQRLKNKNNDEDEDEDENDEEKGGGGSNGEKEYETIMVGEEEGWRYCGACSLYQPPRAAHCPDCNVCVEEYDHHCPWMGTCIGKKNMSAFMCFNLTWLIYLLYSCIWVVALGPISVHPKK
jgi:hypothetical protein